MRGAVPVAPLTRVLTGVSDAVGEAALAEVVVTLTRFGSCAPQGFFTLQLFWQVESPLHFRTHWLLVSVQV